MIFYNSLFEIIHLDLLLYMSFTLLFVMSSTQCNIWFVVSLLRYFVFHCYFSITSYRYFSHYNIIKFIDFESIYYDINLTVVSFSMVFKNLYMCFH